MRQGDLIKFDVMSFGSSGEGVGKVGDIFVYAKNALEGEKVAARVIYHKGKVAFADTKLILKASQDRQPPKCQKFFKCGGCQLQHIKYQKQLDIKRNQVKTALKKLGGIDIDIPDVVKSPCEWGYRNKIQLPVAQIGTRTAIGLFQDGTHKVVAVQECPLTGEWTKPLIDAVQKYMDTCGVKAYDEKNHTGLIRHIVGRYLSGQLLLTIVTNGSSLPKCEVLQSALSQYFEKWGLFINENTQKTNVILGKHTQWIAGIKEIKSSALGVNFSLQPDSFFQVNFEVMQALYSRVKELLETSKTEVLIDCFSGAGVLSAFLYNNEVKEYAIEIVKSAHIDAEKIKKQNNMQNLINICGDVSIELPKIFANHSKETKTVVLDPPRKGISSSTAELLKTILPQNIIYISCDAATLSRDLKILMSEGKYEIKHLECFDMFPQTKHVETLVVLSHKIPDSHIAVKVDFDDKIDDISKENIKARAEARKPQARTTYKMIQAYVEEHYGFKVHTAYIAEVKRSLGLPMYDAPNAVDIRTHEPQHPTAQMVTAITDALRQYAVI